MKNTIDQITDHFVGLIRSDRPYYNPKELLKSGLPSFVVERIRLLLEDKVREELERQDAIWFDLESKLVQDAREDYIRSSLSASHIPREHLYDVIQQVIQDIVDVFIEPRKKMADYIFRDDEVLSFEEVQSRCVQLTIYKHFGTAIPLYMKKRELDELSKKRCGLLIQQLDAKLVASYRPQDWVQKLEQLFVLFGGNVDPELLAVFFKDKGMEAMAAQFEDLEEPLDKSTFISVLTGEVIPSSKKKSSSKKQGGRGDEESTLMESFFGNYDEEPGSASLAEQYKESTLTDDEMSELLNNIAHEGVIEVEDLDPVESLNELFIMRSEEDDGISQTAEEIAEDLKKREDEGQDENREFRDNLISILDQARSSYDGMSEPEEEDEEEPEEEVVDSEPSADTDVETENDSDAADSEPDGEDEPMWAQFLSKDQMDVMMGGSRKAETAPVASEIADENEDEFITISETFTEDIIDDQNEAEQLSELLQSRKGEFIEVIFNGSDDAYAKAIKKIESFDEWKETSNYIQKEIFKKNKVDMLDGATVDFTDRLHTYFNERRST